MKYLIGILVLYLFYWMLSEARRLAEANKDIYRNELKKRNYGNKKDTTQKEGHN